MKQRQLSQTTRPGEPPFITAVVDELQRHDALEQRVREAYASVGHRLDEVEDAALLVDPFVYDCPIVGASRGFCNYTGNVREEVLGRNCRMMLDGVPEVAVSKSVRKNLRDFCRMNRVRGLACISEVVSLQPNARRDGSQFMCHFLIGRIVVRKRPFLLGVLRSLGDGLLVRTTARLLEEVTEAARAVFKRVGDRIQADCATGMSPQPRTAATVAPGFTFFTGRLQDHCLILNEGVTALRREPEELATNCLVFGNSPVRHTTEGLFFAFVVDDVVPTFEGLPLVGFTRRKPTDSPDLYPAVCRCLGASILVGACGEAFARDQQEHFRIGFKPPPQEEVQSWALQPQLPPHKRRPPVNACRGDVFGCQYTRCGRIQLWRNGDLVIDFETSRPVVEGVDYYAVMDVCLSAYCVTLLPAISCGDYLAQVPSPGRPPQPEDSDTLGLDDEVLSLPPDAADIPNKIDAMVLDVVNHALVKKVIRTVVGECQFCVTIADPKGHDIPLIAVSEGFEAVTGYKRSEILGMNCRFLNQGCPVTPIDLMGLRMASESGSAFTALLPNRKKSGEMFVNLLDLRGLTIARHVETNEELWYLIGIQADVTGLTGSDVPQDHLPELRKVVNMIRARLRKELSLLAAGGAERFDRQLTSSSSSDPLDTSVSGSWKLLEEPQWTGTLLSQEAVLEMAERRRSKANTAHGEPLNPGGVVLARPGFMAASAVATAILAFVVGILFGRLTRRT